MHEQMRRSIEALAEDAESGASELLPRAVRILEAALAEGPDAVIDAARRVCGAQPSMASIWNAAAAALADASAPGALARFEQRRQRAGAALRRVAVRSLHSENAAPLRFVTCSFSGTVAGVLLDLSGTGRITVACAEGRPRYEGRRLAATLARAGIAVDLYTDAAAGSALGGSDGLLVGADALTPDWFVNKCGTLALASAAAAWHVPVYVLATRDKFLPPSLVGPIRFRDHDASEVWAEAPAGVHVRNRYFERVPLHLVAAVITDAGLLGIDMVEEVCRANGLLVPKEALDALASIV